MQELRIYHSKLKAVFFLVMSIVFVALCSFGFIVSVIEGKPQWTLLLGMLFSLTCTMLFIIRLTNKKPMLILNSHGIRLSSGRLVPWCTVEWVKHKKIGTRYTTNNFIVVGVANPEEFVAGYGPFKRHLSYWNTLTIGSPIAIHAQGLKIKPQELYKTITSYHENFS